MYTKGETYCPLKVRLEEHRKAVVQGEIEKLRIADHIGREKGNYLALRDEVKIIDKCCIAMTMINYRNT